MAVIGIGKKYPTGILNGQETPCVRTGTAADPGCPFVGRIKDTFIGSRKNLIAVTNEIFKGTGAAATVAAYPRCPAVCGILNSVVGRINPDKFRSV